MIVALILELTAKWISSRTDVSVEMGAFHQPVPRARCICTCAVMNIPKPRMVLLIKYAKRMISRLPCQIKAAVMIMVVIMLWTRLTVPCSLILLVTCKMPVDVSTLKLASKPMAKTVNIHEAAGGLEKLLDAQPAVTATTRKASTETMASVSPAAFIRAEALFFSSFSRYSPP